MKRPLFVIGCSYFLFTAAALFFGDNFAAAVGVWTLVSAAAAFFIVPPEYRGVTAAVLLSGALALGMTLAQDMALVRPVLSLAGKSVYLQGRVERIDYYETSACYLLDARIPQKNGKTLRARIKLYHPAALPTEINEEIRGFVALDRPNVTGPARYANLSGRILLSGSLDGEAEIVEKERAQRTAAFFAAELRQFLTARCRQLLTPESSSLVNAILLGDRSALDEDAQTEFRRAGISHLMAVSGFHLSLVTALTVGLLRAMRVARRLCAALALPVMALFMAVCGFTPSVMRAGLMTGLCLTAQILGEKYDALSALGFAAFLICFLNPYSALNAGFLLSFCASAGIFLLSPRIDAFFSRRLCLPENLSAAKAMRMLSASLSVSLGAFLATLPVLLFCFDTMSLIAPVSSVLAMPLATLLLWCALPMLLLSLIPSLMPAARLFSAAVSVLSRMLTDLCGALSDIPFASVPVRYNFIRVLALVFCAGAAALSAAGARKKTKRVCAALAAAVFAAGLFTVQWTMRGTLRLVTFEGVDAAVILSGKEAALIGFPSTPYQGKIVRAFLRDENVRVLDLALNTSPNNENALGVLDVLRDYPPRRLVIPPEGRYTQNILALSPGARRGVPSRDKNDEVSISGARLTLIPCACGHGCKITANAAVLLKLNENCAIINPDPQTAGVVRGWNFETAGAVSGRPGMSVASDGERRTTYTFRRLEGT